jgi:hypothetical protein
MEASQNVNDVLPQQQKKYNIKDKMNKFLNTSITVKSILIILAVLYILFTTVTMILSASGISLSSFENKNYDPYGTGIRFLQARDDTGSPSTNMNERKYQVANSATKISPLTSSPEGPNFSEGYNIDAKIDNGSVMLERENFENSALGAEDLEMALKGR